MKKTLLVIFAAALLTAFDKPAQAQEKMNVVKFNAFGAIVGQYQLAFERMLTEKMSAQLAVGYIRQPSSQTWDFGTSQNSYEAVNSGFIVIPEFRYYLVGDAPPQGLYASAFFRYRSVTDDLDDTSNPMGDDVSRVDKVTSVGGGVLLGYQLLLGDVFAIDIFIGPQYKTRSLKREYDDPDLNQPSDDTTFDLEGDEEFAGKFADFKVKDKAGAGVRFGINLGFAF